MFYFEALVYVYSVCVYLMLLMVLLVRWSIFDSACVCPECFCCGRNFRSGGRPWTVRPKLIMARKRRQKNINRYCTQKAKSGTQSKNYD
jgi:hypothetical protein